MRIVLQRVSHAQVTVEGETIGAIGSGLLLLLGVAEGDTERECDYLVEKVAHLRIFEDADGKMNRSLLDIQGEMLLVSQFTLYGDCRKGRRPAFVGAARPEVAVPLYERFRERIAALGIPVATGRFGAHMEVSLLNDGPVTILLDTAELLG